MPTQSQIQTTRARANDAVLGTFIGPSKWQPPANLRDLLDDRNVYDRIVVWFARWNSELSTTTSRNLVGAAQNAQVTENLRSLTVEYGARRPDTFRWLEKSVPNPDGSRWWIDLGNPEQMRDVFEDAVRAGGGGVGAYRPSNYQQAFDWARARTGLFTAGATYATNFAVNALRQLGNWYATENAKIAARNAAANQANEQAAAEREMERQADARAQWEAEAPERRARMLADFRRRIAGTRTEAKIASKLQALRENIGADGVLTTFRAAAIAAEQAQAEGATQSEQDAAADAVIDAAISALDALYPLETPDYYVGTWYMLPIDWQYLYMAAYLYADAPDVDVIPVADPGFYVSTVATLPQPWQNLFFQLSQNED